MTRLLVRPILFALLLVLVAAAGPVAARRPAPPPAPPANPTWQLVDYQQKVCFSSRTTTSYFGIWIDGTWSHEINVGIDGLPAGGSYGTAYAPIPPGSSDGVYSVAYVRVTLKSQKLGTTTSSLWASDGTTREAVPVTIVVQDSCRDY